MNTSWHPYKFILLCYYEKNTGSLQVIVGPDFKDTVYDVTQTLLLRQHYGYA